MADSKFKTSSSVPIKPPTSLRVMVKIIMQCILQFARKILFASKQCIFFLRVSHLRLGASMFLTNILEKFSDS